MSQQESRRRSDSSPADGEALERVGTSLRRVDALGKVTGEAEYTGDIPFDDLAHARLVRSRVAHGVLESVDTEPARAIDGVIDVVTAADIPGEPAIGPVEPDQPVLNAEKVRYLGDPIAIVVAEDEATALEGVDAVDVTYDRLSHALTAEAALADDAEPIHEDGNLMDEFGFARGDVDGTFAAADVVVADTYSTAMIDHVPLEPEAAVARRTYEDTVEVWTSTQHAQGDRGTVARVLGLSERDVEVTRPAVGGGFGSKIGSQQPCYAALAAWQTERPVRVRYKRDDEFTGTAKRNTLEYECRVAADDDGTLRGVDVDIQADGGAYASFTVPVVVRSMVHCTGPYNVDTVRVNGRAVYTNKPWAGAMRSFDMFQKTLAIESTLDQVAAACDVEPLALRRRNAFDGTEPMATTGQDIDAVGLPATIESVGDALADLALDEPSDPAKRRGVGVASMWYGCGKTGHHHPSSAFCELHADGTATVQCGVAEIGQGSDTALTQIAAEALGIPATDVKLVTDTSTAPDAGVTSASRQTYVSGNAVQRAVEDALATVRSTAVGLFAGKFDVTVAPAALVFAEGRVTDPASGASVSLEEAVRHAISEGQLVTGAAAFTPLFDFDLETFRGAPYPTYSFASHGAVVEVDVQTGDIEVEHIVAAHDVGRAVNPAMAEGQIEGGAVMGMGHTLMEAVELDEQGQILNASLMDYHIPTSLHAPSIETDLIESAPEDTGPYGAKGVGESALIPIGPAIANAVADATGTRVRDLPLSPATVVAELPDDLTAP